MNDNQNKHYIYVLLDESGIVFYVGKTMRPTKRIHRHVEEVRKGNHLPVYNKLRQVLNRNGWKRQGILKVIEENISAEDIDARETFHIKLYKSRGIKLKNLTEGGEGGKGFTREIIERGAAKRRGKPRSEICKRRISEAKMGIPLTIAHKSALKEAWKSRPPISQEVRNLVGLKNRGVVNIKKFVVQSPSGKCFITTRGLSDFCREHGLEVRNLHATLKGKRKHHRGWRISPVESKA